MVQVYLASLRVLLKRDEAKYTCTVKNITKSTIYNITRRAENDFGYKRKTGSVNIA